MAKVHQKKVIAALLAASIAVPTPAFAASASDFTDFPKDWSAAALTHSVYNGLLSGSEGKDPRVGNLEAGGNGSDHQSSGRRRKRGIS